MKVAMLSLLLVTKTNAQKYVVDITDSRVAYYKALMRQNADKIRFIEYALAQQGIPKQLRNLAIIESGMINKSLSWAQAAGTWQFTPAAAATYGMGITNENDERYDLYKSTFAAAKYLKNLYAMYYDWKIVVAAYNCGSGNVNKAIRKAGSTNYDLLCAYLPNETREHVKKFMLACYATGELPLMQVADDMRAKKTSIGKAIQYKEPVTQTVLTGGYKLTVIAQFLHMPIAQIKKLNPHIEGELAKTGQSALALPIDKMPDFLLQKTEILSASIN